MRGEFIGVWSETWREIWLPLIDHENVPEDILSELYRELSDALKVKPTAQALADVIANPAKSRDAFEKSSPDSFSGERALVTFFEAVHEALTGLPVQSLTDRYYDLLTRFIERFSLRYDLRRPCTLCPTLPGVFASLMRDLRVLTSRDAHLNDLMTDFDESIRDLRIDCSERRIKTCIQKQVNLLEALGQTYPRVRRKTLGAISKQINSWPHEGIRVALQSLYGFTCDYPGIRHGGTRANAVRTIDMRDLIGVSILLAGFTPYLISALNTDVVYRGT